MIGSILPALQALAEQAVEALVILGVFAVGAVTCVIVCCGPSKDDRPFRDRRP